MESDRTSGGKAWAGWIPLPFLVLLCISARQFLAPWQFMWGLAFAIFAGLKWLTWWKARSHSPHSAWRSIGYLFAWPGMDAATFLDERPLPSPQHYNWLPAILKTLLGAMLIWGVARQIPANHPLLRGWIGMLGLIFLLHFGSFELLFNFWRRLGVNATRVMNAPLRSTSLSEFWGKRWNAPFRLLSHELIFRPAAKRWNPTLAVILVFFGSGVIHDFVISLPAGGGYGLPTIYFTLQGLGMIFERSAVGEKMGITKGVGGWVFMAVCTAGPAVLLFHRPFVMRVIIPFMGAIHAL